MTDSQASPARLLDAPGMIAAILGAALFSAKPVFVKLAYAHQVAPETLLALRMGFALPFYVVIGLLTWRRMALEARPGGALMLKSALVGILGYYLASMLDFYGLLEITAQLERLILFTYPFFVVLLGAAFFNRPLRPLTIPALLIAYAGIAIVFARNMALDAQAQIWLGSALVLGAALTFALFQLFGGRIVPKMGAGLYTSLAMSAAAGAVFAHFALTQPMASLMQPAPVLMHGFAIAIICTVFPSYLMSFALGRIGADGNAMIGNIGPFFTLFMAALWLNEPFGPWEALGATMVIGAMLLFSRGRRL